MEKSVVGRRTAVERRHVMLEQQDTVSTSKEIVSMTKMLAEKDAALSAQAEQLQKLQKEYTFNLHRRAAQNEEIILHNKTLYKENLQLREQMKIMQHEHNQMASMFKMMEAELRFKIEEMQHQLNVLLMDKQMQISHKAALTALKTQARTTSRRHSISTGHLLQDIDYNRPCSNVPSKTKDEAPTSRSLRSKGAAGPKETSFKERWDLPVAASKSIYGRCKVSGLEAMDRVSEGDESVSSCPSAESLAQEFEVSARVEDTEGVNGVVVKCQKQRRSRKSGFVLTAPAAEAVDCCRSSLDGNDPLDENVSAGNRELSMVTTKSGKQPRQGLSSVAVKSESPQSPLHPPIVTGSGRPLRRATANVASYKEPPLNTKMRRPV